MVYIGGQNKKSPCCTQVVSLATSSAKCCFSLTGSLLLLIGTGDGGGCCLRFICGLTS